MSGAPKKKRKPAALRVCASCEWIFKGGVECPKCQFGSYGARYVYGAAAYRYALTQEPWRENKLASYALKLDAEIRAAQPSKGGKHGALFLL